jgi:hypothetical protein
MENIENNYPAFDPETDDDYDDSLPEQDLLTNTVPVAIGFAALDTIQSRSDLIHSSGLPNRAAIVEDFNLTRAILLSEKDGFNRLEYLLPPQQQRKNDLQKKIDHIDKNLLSLGERDALVIKRAEINILNRNERAELNRQINDIDKQIKAELHTSFKVDNKAAIPGKTEKKHNIGRKVLYFLKAVDAGVIRFSASGSALSGYKQKPEKVYEQENT